MKVATCKIQGITPYSQSAPILTEKKNKEAAKEFEKRIWRERMHVNDDGNVFIPMMAFKHVMSDVAMYLSEKIEGKGNNTWTKHFTAGVLPMGDADLGVKADTIKGEWIFCSSDGKPGGRSKVWKCFPVVPKWECEIQYHIADDIIYEEVFTRYLRQAGALIGIGRWRPRNGGLYGRFKVLTVYWQED